MCDLLFALTSVVLSCIRQALMAARTKVVLDVDSRPQASEPDRDIISAHKLCACDDTAHSAGEVIVGKAFFNRVYSS
ncbi:hypothetical protein EDB87DRAFT_1623188 [Lactarius vividus]|nr:hypothetical protein EDB87DRAFT_1623188 [Lactarius vividus]